jgi:hypothetical protein
MFDNFLLPGGVWPLEVAQAPRPRIRINPAFKAWVRTDPLPPKYECAGSDARGTGNTQEQAYQAWAQQYGLAERERRMKAVARHAQAMQNAAGYGPRDGLWGIAG